MPVPEWLWLAMASFSPMCRTTALQVSPSSADLLEDLRMVLRLIAILLPLLAQILVQDAA
jgi:hypothetical protein